MKNTSVYTLTCSALCMALALTLPFLTGQIPQIGNMLCPMHIPVLLCGFICGWPWGLGVGFCAPLLRSLIFGMPTLFPTALAMAFELATYGFLCGLLYRRFPQRPIYTYLSLLLAMVAGRVVWGGAFWALMGIKGGSFTFAAFLAGAVTNAVPGIVLQIVLVPAIVLTLQKAKLIHHT